MEQPQQSTDTIVGACQPHKPASTPSWAADCLLVANEPAGAQADADLWRHIEETSQVHVVVAVLQELSLPPGSDRQSKYSEKASGENLLLGRRTMFLRSEVAFQSLLINTGKGLIEDRHVCGPRHRRIHRQEVRNVFVSSILP